MAQFDSNDLPEHLISAEEKKEIRLLAKLVREFGLCVRQQWKTADGMVKTITRWKVPAYTDEPALGSSRHRAYVHKATGRKGYLWSQPEAIGNETVIVTVNERDGNKNGERMKPSEFLKWLKDSKADVCGKAIPGPLPITTAMVQQRLQALQKEDGGKPVEWEKGANKDV